MLTNCKAYTDTLHCGGEPTVVGEASGNPYMYTGREYDPETGLYFFRNRYQSPILGRFISEDPLGVEAGLNFYAYVGGDPVNFTDPWGLDPSIHFDRDSNNNRLIHDKDSGYRFDKNGRPVDHSGREQRVPDKKKNQVRKVLNRLKNKFPNFFGETPKGIAPLLMLECQKQIINNLEGGCDVDAPKCPPDG